MQQFYPEVNIQLLFSRSILTLRKRRLLLFSCAFIVGLSAIRGQDIHYSQFHNAPFEINPALTGIARGDIRVMGNYRGQWGSVPVGYKTYSIAADMQFIERYYKEGFFSGGLMLTHDQAGLSQLRSIDIGLNASYTKKLSPYIYTTIGIQLSANQRAFKLDDLTFDSQYDDNRGIFDESSSINENFSNQSNFFIDFAAGFNLRFQSHDNAVLVDRLEKRTKLDVGLGIFHITMPDQSFIDGYESLLPMRLSPYAQGTLKVTNGLDIIANGLAQFQYPYREFVVMGGAKLYISRQLGKQLAVQFDLGYRFNERFGDAYFPGLELQYNGWHLGFTYDVNVSDFQLATDGRGGPEISIRHLIRRVRPLQTFRACPLM